MYGSSRNSNECPCHKILSRNSEYWWTRPVGKTLSSNLTLHTTGRRHKTFSFLRVSFSASVGASQSLYKQNDFLLYDKSAVDGMIQCNWPEALFSFLSYCQMIRQKAYFVWPTPTSALAFNRTWTLQKY